MVQKPLDPLFRPKAIAVIGATKTPDKVGHDVLKNLISYGFKGPIYPINPKYSEIYDIKCYPTVLDVVDRIDLAVITVPVEWTIKLMSELAAKGVKAAIITSDVEKGKEELVEQLRSAAERNGIKMIGPETFGLIYTHSRLNATYMKESDIRPGHVALMSISTHLTAAIVSMANYQKVGLSAVVQLGESPTVTEAEVLDWLVEDRRTRVIVVMFGDISDELLSYMEHSSEKKPIIAVSHPTYLSRLILEASSVREALNWALTFASKKRYSGDRTIVVTNDEKATEALKVMVKETSLNLVEIPDEVAKEVNMSTPEDVPLENPLAVPVKLPSYAFTGILEKASLSPDVDNVVIAYFESPFSDPSNVVNSVLSVWDRTEKMITISLVGGKRSAEAIMKLRDKGVPAYFMPEDALKSLDSFIRWHGSRSGKQRT